MRLAIFLLCFVFFMIEPAHARAPNCGLLNGAEYERIYGDAKTIKRHYNVVSDMRKACSALVDMEAGEGGHSVNQEQLFTDDVYMAKRREGLQGVKNSILGMGRPLSVLNNWYATMPMSSDPQPDEVKRAFVNLKRFHRALNRSVGNIEGAVSFADEHHIHSATCGH